MLHPRLRVIPYFSPGSETTTHLVARRDRHEALLVDPVNLDRELFQLLITHELDLRAVLITHPETYMIRALKTIQKIFDLEVISGSRDVPAARRRHLEDETDVDCCGMTFHAIPVLPHSRSSFVYQLDALVFTGSIVHAGTLGETATAFAEALLVATVKDYLFTLPEDTLMLPSVGPPSTLLAERTLSPYYRDPAAVSEEPS